MKKHNYLKSFFIPFVFFGSFVFSTAVWSQTMKPGVWKGQVHFTVNGIPLPSTEDEDCILPHEAKDVKSALTKNLVKKGCTITKWEVQGQNLSAALTCKNKDLDAKGKIKGQFSQQDYKLKGEAEGTYKDMLPAVAAVELKGQWVKSCTN